jgi:2-polyprenyl-3-methyl-5-hydroxy-6-metoxy-1,4-benzoquinol methylase
LSTNQSFIFIKPHDELAQLINEKANFIYHQLKNLNIDELEFDAFGKYYFSNHHVGRRLFFSMQSSADIIYRSVQKINKPLSSISLLDYGAGLGTLFLLASQVGFKKVYYNDYFQSWTLNAQKLCSKLNIHIEGFITGDIDAAIEYGLSNNIRFDIVASRNVVEHIYRLRDFYTKLYQSGLTTICYSTTTANYHNIAMRLKHFGVHRRVERTQFKGHREARIKELQPGIAGNDLQQLVEITRGRAFDDFINAIELYMNRQPVPPVEFLGTNTCDYKTGVWAENLLTRKTYKIIIEDAGFSSDYTPGFWDTHYKYGMFNLMGACFNAIIKISGKKGYWLSPFVNVVAYIK